MPRRAIFFTTKPRLVTFAATSTTKKEKSMSRKSNHLPRLFKLKGEIAIVQSYRGGSGRQLDRRARLLAWINPKNPASVDAVVAFFRRRLEALLRKAERSRPRASSSARARTGRGRSISPED